MRWVRGVRGGPTSRPLARTQAQYVQLNPNRDSDPAKSASLRL